MFEHQISGLEFLYENFRKNHGCILADDMGLGKTVQIGTYLSSLIFEGLIRRAIVVVPATLIEYWMSEIQKMASSWQESSNTEDIWTIEFEGRHGQVGH